MKFSTRYEVGFGERLVLKSKKSAIFGKNGNTRGIRIKWTFFRNKWPGVFSVYLIGPIYDLCMVYQLKKIKSSSQMLSSITVVTHIWFLVPNNRITVLLLDLALKTLCLSMDYYMWYLVGFLMKSIMQCKKSPAGTLWELFARSYVL